MRVRVDGKVHEIDAVPKLAKTTKHTIEVVVDRLQGARRVQAAAGRVVRDRAAQRRRPRDRGRDGHGERRSTCSRPSSRARSATTRCGARAAAVLVQQPARRVPALRRPRARSASSIPSASSPFRSSRSPRARSSGWDRRNQFYFQMLHEPREARRLRHRAAVREAARARAEPHPLRLAATRRSRSPTCPSAASRSTREHAFEGILPNLERRYRETDSVMVREELAKYLNNKPCPECDGTRLRREARFVKVGEGDAARAIYEVSACRSRRRSEFFRGCRSTARRRRSPTGSSRRS